MKTQHRSARAGQPVLSAAKTESGYGRKIRQHAASSKHAVLALVGIIVASLVGGLAIPAEAAECPGWYAGSKWGIRQSNGPFVGVRLEQRENLLQGDAAYTFDSQDKILLLFDGAQRTNIIRGSVDGSIKGTDFTIHIYWENGEIGIYTGKISPSGKVEGDTYSKQDPKRKATWFSDGVLACIDPDSAPGGPPTPAKPVNPAATRVPPKPVKPTNAQPPNWDVGDEWQLSQGDGKTVTLKLNQKGGDFTGSATIGKPNAPGYAQGKVEGFVTADTFSARVTWAATIITKVNSVADYSGTMTAQGMINGTLNRGTSTQQSWSSLTTMKREGGKGETANSPTSPLSTPMKHLRVSSPLVGAAAPAAPDVAPKAPSGKGAPTINASSKLVTIPTHQAKGTTTLTWDGGPDHSYAEVWVEEDGQDATKIVEQGKGSRRVEVESGKTYRFILTDSGKELATVTVKAK